MAAPVVASNGASSGSFAGITLPNPFASAAAADDLQLWINETLGGEAITFGSANGCAILSSGVSENSTNTRLTPIWRLFASQSDGTVNDPGDHILSRGLTIQGQHLTDPFHLVATGTLAAGTSDTIVTGLTTTVDECLIILMVTSLGPDASSANSSEFTASNGNLSSVAEVFETTSNRNAGQGVFVVQGTLATAGAVGSFSITSANSTPKAWACIAIQPPASGEDVTDGIVLGDSVQAQGSNSKSLTDGLALGDSVAEQLTFSARSATDGLVLGDSVLGGQARAVSDGIKLGEDIDTTLTIDSGPDGLLLGDSVSVTWSIPRSVSDGLSLGDSATGGAARSTADGISLGDSVQALVTYARVATDGLVLGDIASSGAAPRSVTDGITLGDSVTRSVAYVGVASDGLVLGDSVLRAVSYPAALSDGLVLGDSLLALLSASRAASDGVKLGDSVAATTALYPAPRNTLGPDTVYRYLGANDG